MDVLCFTKFELVYYFLLMLPNLPTVAQQPARAVSTGKMSTVSFRHSLTTGGAFSVHSVMSSFAFSSSFSALGICALFYASWGLLKQCSVLSRCR